MANEVIVTRCDGVINYLRTLKDEDNGSGIIEETAFDRWFQQILDSIDLSNE